MGPEMALTDSFLSYAPVRRSYSSGATGLGRHSHQTFGDASPLKKIDKERITLINLRLIVDDDSSWPEEDDWDVPPPVPSRPWIDRPWIEDPWDPPRRRDPWVDPWEPRRPSCYCLGHHCGCAHLGGGYKPL